MITTRKKLIEVALPLEELNRASLREGYIYKGNPSALHKWWAQRPLAAARAIVFAQMVDDPSANPDLFQTEKAQQKERARLFKIVEDLVKWENMTNEEVLSRARDEIWQSWRRACAQNAEDPRSNELFDRNVLPVFYDPFAGSGALPLEAQRLGLVSYASDLNPVAVLINKAVIEIPPRFVGKEPVNSEARQDSTLFAGKWKGAQGLADDVRYYGHWMRDEAQKRIGHLYPTVPVTENMAKERPDLTTSVGKQLPVIAWLWARTVRSPNPAFAKVDVPLASTFMLSTKKGKEAYVEPIIDEDGYRFTVRVGTPRDFESAKAGTKLARANFRCLMSGSPVSGEYIKAEGMGKRIGARLMATVALADRRRVYVSPSSDHEAAALQAKPDWKPEGDIPKRMTGGNCTPYGLTTWADLFTPRQMVALTTFSNLVGEARERIRLDAIAAGWSDDEKPLREGGTGALAYAEAVGLYLAFATDKTAEYGCTGVTWNSLEDRPKTVFARQVIPMVWDYVEVNPLCDIGGSFAGSIRIVTEALSGCAPYGHVGKVSQQDAVRTELAVGAVVSTDPPYYDNIGYADLSDFFYPWLRNSLRSVFPELFTTVAVPKDEELVATPSRHGSREKAEAFFLGGMTRAMRQLAEQSHPAFPITIYYAFKQSETGKTEGTASTGWETFLEAVISAGFAITGTWPVRTERSGGLRTFRQNALASSIVLVCRPRALEAPTATRREFVAALKSVLPQALTDLQRGNIAPVDLAQAAIGPGMAVYTRYGRVLDAEGSPLGVRDALTLINQTLDEALTEQEGDFDADSRWALAWFEQYGFSDGDFGVADVLARAKNTSVQGLVDAGILSSSRGDVRLLRPSELVADWDPSTDTRLSAWESVHQLVRALEADGEGVAAKLVAKLGGNAELARELCYRLYTFCERKKRAAEALSYNGLVQSFPELERLAKELRRKAPEQPSMLIEDQE